MMVATVVSGNAEAQQSKAKASAKTPSSASQMQLRPVDFLAQYGVFPFADLKPNTENPYVVQYRDVDMAYLAVMKELAADLIVKYYTKGNIDEVKKDPLVLGTRSSFLPKPDTAARRLADVTSSSTRGVVYFVREGQKEVVSAFYLDVENWLVMEAVKGMESLRRAQAPVFCHGSVLGAKPTETCKAR